MADDIRRKFIAAGVNTVDMNERGERRVSLATYGNAYSIKSVEAALQAWQVVDRYLLNPGPGGKPADPNNDGGPKYMLKFADGYWRYATFGGVNGPPWTYCPPEGFRGKTGREAELRRQVTMQSAKVNSLKNQYHSAQAELTALRIELNKETGGGEPSTDESERPGDGEGR